MKSQVGNISVKVMVLMAAVLTLPLGQGMARAWPGHGARGAQEQKCPHASISLPAFRCLVLTLFDTALTLVLLPLNLLRVLKCLRCNGRFEHDMMCSHEYVLAHYWGYPKHQCPNGSMTPRVSFQGWICPDARLQLLQVHPSKAFKAVSMGNPQFSSSEQVLRAASQRRRRVLVSIQGSTSYEDKTTFLFWRGSGGGGGVLQLSCAAKLG